MFIGHGDTPFQKFQETDMDFTSKEKQVWSAELKTLDREQYVVGSQRVELETLDWEQYLVGSQSSEGVCLSPVLLPVDSCHCSHILPGPFQSLTPMMMKMILKINMVLMIADDFQGRSLWWKRTNADASLNFASQQNAKKNALPAKCARRRSASANKVSIFQINELQLNSAIMDPRVTKIRLIWN